MEEKRTIGERCKDTWNRHKKKIKFVGGTLLALAGGYFLVTNWDDISEVFNSLPDVQSIPELPTATVEVVAETVSEPLLDVVTPMREITVRAHTMTLPEGKHASEAAKAFAEECGIVLGERQTMRHGCIKQIAA